MHAHAVVAPNVYFRTALVLLVLMVVTVGASKVDLGYFNTPLAVLIAMTKAVLIVLFFMNVRNGSPLLKIFASGGFVWLVILFVLSFSDYLTRDTTATTPVEAARSEVQAQVNPPTHGRD